MGFSNTNPPHIWTRTFAEHHYTLSVDTAGQGSIDYGAGIKVGRATTTNLLDLECLVVLECVTSLLGAGYEPASIELEVPFRVGRRPGGYLDVLIRQAGRTYLMLECKTVGVEFDAALAKLLNDPESQLMTYVQQDRDAKQAVLYTSTIDTSSGSPVVYRTYAGFPTATLEGNSAKQLFADWDKKFYTKGLIESSPYTVKEKSLTVADLQDMTQADGQELFNDFAEILWRHAISDKPNAFNKIFNLFVCKIFDEEKTGPSEVLEFQWRSAESFTAVLDRLSDLFARGMKEYLSLDMADHSTSEIEGIASSLAQTDRDTLARLFAEVRQYNSTTFAFMDVFDKNSYEQNALVVRDIVCLLQRKRLRYTQKHGFMGMFFEKLLNTSMKQESGQFFTPAPIAQFVNEALPIEDIVDGKIRDRSNNFLPYAIDYAAGSGHFLTEYLSRADGVLQGLTDPAVFKSKGQKQNANAWRDGFGWAQEFVYGVELDYRLAKTAKVSTFLNGDGKANIVRANGLGHFHRDPGFASIGGKLWKAADTPGDRDNARFDVVIGNPPYSVAEFRLGVQDGDASFELWDRLTDKSDDIEVLFVERTKQLLVNGGVAGIVLPTSLLSNDGAELYAREMLLRHFEIKAIVMLGGKVFIATDTPTAVLFLRRRPNTDCESIRNAVDTFMNDLLDAPVLGHPNAFTSYAEAVHGVTLDEYCSALSKPLDSDLSIIRDYEWLINNGRSKKLIETRMDDSTGVKVASPRLLDLVRRSETARMEGYFLTRDQRTIVVRAPEETSAKQAFLGYRFSERRRHEGISYLSGTDRIDTPMFDPEDPSNKEKLSTLIKSHFSGDVANVPAPLQDWTQILDLADVVGLVDLSFKWSLAATAASASTAFKAKTERLGTLCEIAIGGTPTTGNRKFYDGKNLWLSIKDMTEGVVTDTKQKITDEAVAASNVKLVKKGTLLLSFKLSIGRTAIAGKDMYTNEAIAALTPKTRPAGAQRWVDTDYLHAIFTLFPGQLLQHESHGQKKIGRSLNMADLRGVHVPVLTDAERADLVAIATDPEISVEDKVATIRPMLWVVPS